MAQQLSYISAVAKGYTAVYASSAGGSASTHLSKGDSCQIYVDADGNMRNENGLTYLKSPSGWVNASNLGDFTDHYITVTDACTAPTSVTLNASTKVLTITGGKGGDLNTFQGYQVSWRDANIGTTSYGSWSADVTVSSSNTTATYSVTAPAGKVRQFRARTIGSAGSSYYSGYVTCNTTLTGNTSPNAPAFKLPVENAISRSQNPAMIITVPADADGDTLTLKRQIDNGSWTNVTTLKSGTYYDQLLGLATGSHTVKYKLADSYAESSVVSRTFTVSPVAWNRPIAIGTVISNATVSHVADINEMLAVLNTQRAFYGLSAVGLPGTIGRFGDWKAQMEVFQAAIIETGNTLNKTIAFSSVPSYPTASIINEIRIQLKEF